MFAQFGRRAIGWFSLLLMVAVGSGPVSALSAEELRRFNEEGPVAVAVTYLNPLEQISEEGLFFEVRMNTHSVDLDAYKKEDHASLRIDGGPEQKAVAWTNPGGGGHHVSGILEFAGTAPSGRSILQLVIRDIGGVPERIFEWQLPLE
jgi:hypothetical protein